jgi:hypothetical protein
MTGQIGAYSVSKHGVVALSESLYKELQQLAPHIGVSVLTPAMVATNIGTMEHWSKVRRNALGPIPPPPPPRSTTPPPPPLPLPLAHRRPGQQPPCSPLRRPPVVRWWGGWGVHGRRRRSCSHAHARTRRRT